MSRCSSDYKMPTQLTMSMTGTPTVKRTFKEWKISAISNLAFSDTSPDGGLIPPREDRLPETNQTSSSMTSTSRAWGCHPRCTKTLSTQSNTFRKETSCRSLLITEQQAQDQTHCSQSMNLCRRTPSSQMFILQAQSTKQRIKLGQILWKLDTKQCLATTIKLGNLQPLSLAQTIGLQQAMRVKKGPRPSKLVGYQWQQTRVNSSQVPRRQLSSKIQCVQVQTCSQEQLVQQTQWAWGL